MKLYKNTNDASVSGVCSGLADYFNIDVTIIRLVFAALIFLPFPIILIYIVMSLVIPDKEDLYPNVKHYTERDMIEASKYGYNYKKITSFISEEFEDNCEASTREWLYLGDKD